MGTKWEQSKHALQQRMDNTRWRSWKWKMSYRVTKFMTRTYYKCELIASLAFIIGSIYLAKEIVEWYMQKQLFSLKRKEKQIDRQQAVEELTARCTSKNMPKDKVYEIVMKKATELVDDLRNGKITPTEALTAYQTRALEVHEEFNVLTEVLKEAEEQAESLAASREEKGLLYGLPVTLKDHYGVKGYDSCCGVSSLINKPAVEDCLFVKVLRKQGAVPFAKLNTSQLMASLDANNPVFGETLHPSDPSRTPGGSSGGCAATVLARGSPLSFGSDIGGSIRHPCANCGVCGLKPTQGRISNKGIPLVPSGLPLIDICQGPLARDVDTLMLAMKALVCDYMFELDRSIPPVPWDEKAITDSRKLKIGYYEWDGVIIPTPACRRAVHQAKAVLEEQGHTLLAWHPPDMDNVTLDLGFASLNIDGGKEFCQYLYADATSPSIKLQRTIFSIPYLIRMALGYLIRPFDPFMGKSILSTCGFWFTSAYTRHAENVQAYRTKVIEEWTAHKFDAVVGPVFPVPAMPKHTESTYAGVGYTMIYNILGFPAGVVPITSVTADDVEAMEVYPSDKPPVPTPLYEEAKKGMKGAEGLPVCVQVAALPWADETCLRVMKEIEKAKA